MAKIINNRTRWTKARYYGTSTKEKKARYTKKQYEQYLNEWYAKYYDGNFIGGVMVDFAGCTSNQWLAFHYARRSLGTLLRKTDSITFDKMYQTRLKAEEKKEVTHA
jgi:hypothetical protein